LGPFQNSREQSSDHHVNGFDPVGPRLAKGPVLGVILARPHREPVQIIVPARPGPLTNQFSTTLFSVYPHLGRRFFISFFSLFHFKVHSSVFSVKNHEELR
jgi:hypothetical protein